MDSNIDDIIGRLERGYHSSGRTLLLDAKEAIRTLKREADINSIASKPLYSRRKLEKEHSALRAALEAIIAYEDAISDPNWNAIHKIGKMARAALAVTSPARS